MNGSRGFSSKSPDELQDFLLHVARRQRAPHASRQRALARVAAVAMGSGVAAGANTALAGAAQASAHWLAAKWFVIGLCTALGALSATEQIRLRSKSAPARLTAVAPAASVIFALAPSAEQTVAPQPQLFASPSPPARTLPAPARAPELPEGAPAPIASSVSASSFAAPSVEQLAREVAALKQARAALVHGSPRAAASSLHRYRAEFPSGVLAVEAAALDVELAFALGERMRGEQLAQSFLREHATSPLASRVRALQKP